MNRRTFTTMFAALILMSGFAVADGFEAYKPGMIKDRLAAGETIFVDYAAVWCSTCKRQAGILTKIRAENSSYDEKISFIKVDWDTYKDHAVTTSRNIPRRSTLLLLRGDEELGRIVAGTDPKVIEDLIAKGL